MDGSILTWPGSRVMPQLPAVLLFGAPGVGKGTQGTILGSMNGMFHISTGEIFRGLDPESKDGKMVAECLGDGDLVPDQLTVEVWRHWLDNQIESGNLKPTHDVLILDGIPRSVEQCRLMEEHINVLAVLHLEVPDDQIIIDRLAGRAIEEGRADDADETIIRKRMAIYRETTSPVLEYYSADTVHAIDPIGTPMAIKKRLLEQIVPAIRSVKEAG
jgi:adenylate kinase